MMVFEKVSPENTVSTLKLAFEKAKTLGGDVVLATTSGASVFTAIDISKEAGYTGKLIAVTHAYGSREPGKNRLSEENRRKLEAAGVTLVTAGHALSGVERGISEKFGGVYPTEIIANALRMLCQGMKVCVEIGTMAIDAGQIEYGRPIIAIGGTGNGLDTACVITPAYSAKIFETNVHEILCKPY